MNVAERVRRGIGICTASLLLFALTGCGMSIPSDPNGTLSRAAGSELRVGIVVEPGLAEPGTPPTGPLPDLASEYATSIETTPEWQIGGEETLVRRLENGRLDIAFGSFSENSPWLDRAALSRPFAVGGSDSRKLVALVPLGENALLADFETFIDEKGHAR